MEAMLDVWISREWGLSPSEVRAWPVDDVDRAVAMLQAEAKAAEFARVQRG